MNIVEVKNVSKNFGRIKVLNDVSLSIAAGETLGLMGESGSGKTTLSRIILKLLEPTKGEVLYHEIENLRRDCQIVFQDPQNSLNPRIMVGEAIEEPVKIHGQGLGARELLEMVKLPADYARRYPHELSGGERQRVGIARALATKPKFVVLDEPVSALDIIVQVEILNLLKKLKDELSLTYLFVAHDPGVIKFMSDRVFTLS